MYTYIHISHYIPPGFDVTGVRGSFCSMCGPTLVLKAGVPKSGVPQNGWFIRETSIKMMNRIEQRYPFFSGNLCISHGNPIRIENPIKQMILLGYFRIGCRDNSQETMVLYHEIRGCLVKIIP